MRTIIGCGTGASAVPLLEKGLDVTGIDPSPYMLDILSATLGNRVSLYRGFAEDLPFDDNSFNHACLFTCLEFVDDPVLVLREAARVARKGILVTFLNKWSFYGWSVRLGRRHSTLARARWFTWPEMRALIQKSVSPGAMEARSILLGPSCTWNAAPVIRLLNSVPVFPWMGAVTAVRIDLTAIPAQTPLMAWNTEPTT